MSDGLIDELHPIIINLRRKVDAERNWIEFRRLVNDQLARICNEVNTRWLISICDTYVDYGDPVERRNAMLITTLVNMEKISQSYLMWRVDYIAPFDVPKACKPRKLKLWDGMTSMHLDIGDVTNNLFRRLHALIKETPVLYAIFNAVVQRLSSNPTILGALNKRHRHVFEPDLQWRDAPEYDPWRMKKELPPLD